MSSKKDDKSPGGNQNKKRRAEDKPVSTSHHKRQRHNPKPVVVHQKENDGPKPTSTPQRGPLTAENLPPLPPINPQLESQVFTHTSITDGRYGPRLVDNYDRLEFYGDACLEMIATRLLYFGFPTVNVKSLSQLRQQLVCNNTLAQFSELYDFPSRLKTAATNSGKVETKVAADIFEAYTAAVILSDEATGYATAERWLAALWQDRLQSSTSPSDGTDYKNELAKHLGGRDDTNTNVRFDYKVTAKPSDRQQMATVEVFLTGWGEENRLMGRASGVGVTAASMEAAKAALIDHAEFIDGIVKKKARMKAERARNKST